MATSISQEELTTTLKEPGNNVPKPNRRKMRKWKYRGIGSSGVLLILVWEFMISGSLFLTLQENNTSSVPGVENGLAFYIGVPVLSISMPVVSLLAEVVIGRYKLVSYSLKAIWLLSIINCIATMTEGKLSIVEFTVLFYIKLFTIEILMVFFFGAYLGVVIPLTIDQIMTQSSSTISASAQWMVWAVFTSYALIDTLVYVINTCSNFLPIAVDMILSLVSVLLLSVGLILDFFLSHKLVREPVTVNPVTLIFKVLKYAAKHKHPVRRSAFTYCENELPSRLDNGKSKYGGPFTNEQVEDVKTFWRILLVIFVIVIALPPIVYHNILPKIRFNKKCTLFYVTQPTFFVMCGIPLYELFVYPCLRNRGPRILQSVGIGAAVIILSSLYGLTAETALYFHSNGAAQCLFTTKEICFLISIPYNAVIGFSSVVFCKSTAEFICAQAPHSMKSLLAGILGTGVVFCCATASLISRIWGIWIITLDSGRYGIWFFLITLVLSVASSVLLGCVAQWYKARERDDITNIQNIVEEIYIREQEQQNA